MRAGNDEAVHREYQNCDRTEAARDTLSASIATPRIPAVAETHEGPIDRLRATTDMRAI
jgi:hypothetical protein